MAYDPSRVQILLVEDDDIDRMAFERAFTRQGIPNKIVYADDGSSALEIMLGNGEQPPLSRPFIVVLDTTLPRMDGFEFLRRVRENEHLRKTVVFVLATSGVYDDVARAYGQLVAGYLVKPTSPDAFRAFAVLFERFLNSVVLPGSTKLIAPRAPS